MIDEKGEARTTDLAERLGVSKVTASKTVQRLVRDGFLSSEPYRSVFLTTEGEQMARAAKERHDIVLAFLLKLGVTNQTAEIDAEGIEHHVSDETLDAMRRFVKE